MKKIRKTADGVPMMATLRKVLRYLRHYRLLLAASLILSVGVVALTLYLPVLTGNAIDLIVAPGRVSYDALGPLLLRGVVVILLTASMCALDAISGTTPPYSLCVSICDATMFERIANISSLYSTIAALVSSHELSIPKMYMYCPLILLFQILIYR